MATPRILNTDLNDGEFEALERNSYYGIGALLWIFPVLQSLGPRLLPRLPMGNLQHEILRRILQGKRCLQLWRSYGLTNLQGFQGGLRIRLTDRDHKAIYTGGTLEIILIFEPLRKRKGGAIKSPRYF